MCDTLALRTADAIWLAKNSDRDPLEAQRVQVIPRVRGDRSARVRCTWIEIPQVPDRHACIVGRPAWMWGAEMGVNECGVAIGNEAIFSREVQREGSALLGMDMLRLALERADSAGAALRLIVELLEQYGQGGPAGYTNGNFRYDNSFLIADARKIWKLETAGHHWVAEEVARADGISNALSIENDYQAASAEIAAIATNGRGINFRRAFDTRLIPWVGASHRRRAASRAALAQLHDYSQVGFADFSAILRSHRKGGPSGNGDLCMHAAAASSPLRALRPSHTVNAMIVRLGDAGPQAVFTGTSSSCLSLFKPVEISSRSNWLVCNPDLWEQHWVHARDWQIDAAARARVQSRIAQAEAQLFSALERGDSERAEQVARHFWRETYGRMPVAAMEPTKEAVEQTDTLKEFI